MTSEATPIGHDYSLPKFITPLAEPLGKDVRSDVDSAISEFVGAFGSELRYCKSLRVYKTAYKTFVLSTDFSQELLEADDRLKIQVYDASSRAIGKLDKAKNKGDNKSWRFITGYRHREFEFTGSEEHILGKNPTLIASYEISQI